MYDMLSSQQSFFIMGLKVEISHVVITLSIYTFDLRNNARYFEIYYFYLQTWKAFFMAFVCSSDLPDATILLAAKLSVCQDSKLLLRHSGGEHKSKCLPPALPVKLIHFSVLDKFSWIKCFSLFISTYIVTQNYLRLWLNVL